VNGSVYWIDPASHNIVLKEPQETMYAKYPRALPADQWYSTDPYIDAQVRKERFERIVLALHDAGFNVGAWANRVIEDVKFNRDKARTASANGDAISAGEFEVAGGKDAESILNLTEEKRTLEVAGQHSPLAAEESKEHTAKALPMYPAQDTQPSDAGKPLAEPPLFRLAGDSPRMVRKMETHTILYYNGWYYGIPAALNDIDVTSPESAATAGILRYPTEEEVIAAIEESGRWANSRGHYDDQKKQRASGSYMRVDSVGEMSESAEIPGKFRILQFGKTHIAVDQEVLRDPFGRRSFVERKSKGQRESKHLSVWRRMAELLPASFEEELRRLIRQERFNSGNGGYLSDLQLARMLPHAVAVAYVKEPLKRIMRSVTGRGIGSETPAGVPVKGEDFSILSVVTKNTQPELLWTIGNYNLVKFDGMFYGVPHGAYVEWDSGFVASVPGVLIGETIAEVDGMIRKLQGKTGEVSVAPADGRVHASGFTKSPVLLRAMPEEGYDVISYEGWIYGMPHALGSIDLTEIDVIEMPGVIRDVSRDAVENEILALGRNNNRSCSTVEV
jgi:hypothetical protein